MLQKYSPAGNTANQSGTVGILSIATRRIAILTQQRPNVETSGLQNLSI
jgi:hypothetical protein